MRRLLFSSTVSIIITSIVYANDVEFSASAPAVVKVGETFQFSYTINERPKGFYAPDFNALQFDVLSGPNSSTSSSFQVINGKMTQSFKITYTYFLRARNEGNFTIPPAKITVGQNEIECNQISIQVVKGSNPAPAKSGNQPQNATQQKVQTSDENLFAKIIVNKSNVYQGESVIATIKLFSKLNLSQIDNAKFPPFTGFLKEEIQTPPISSLEREVMNGQVYGTAVVKRYVLFPQHDGDITIDPFELDCYYQQRVNTRQRSIFDDFFGNYKTVKKHIKSEPVRIKVRSLPGTSLQSFSGGVGNYSMSSSIDRENVKTNDAITFKLTVTGNGNLKLLNAPKIIFPPDFEVYDPKISQNLKNSLNGVTGSKIFEYLIIPRHAGGFKIPPVELSYFDLNMNSYKTLKTREYPIIVEKGDVEDESQTVISGFSKEELKFVGTDIRYIKVENKNLRLVHSFILLNFKFYLFYIIPLVLLAVILIIHRNRMKRNANIQKMRNRKANKVAKKHLKLASLLLKKERTEDFYDELLKAIWGYLGDKLNIPVADLRKEKAIGILKQENVKEELLHSLTELIDTCEYARYAPKSDITEIGDVYLKAVNTISKLENNLK
ncbi:BatD family protein [Bacteroidota bacterium]